jgi:hypothetical protein
MAGLICSILLISPCKPSEYRLGRHGYTPLTTFLYSSSILEAVKGGLKAAASYRTQPTDQMSHLES